MCKSAEGFLEGGRERKNLRSGVDCGPPGLGTRSRQPGSGRAAWGFTQREWSLPGPSSLGCGERGWEAVPGGDRNPPGLGHGREKP